MIDWLTALFIIMGLLFMFAAFEKMRENDWFWSFILTLLSTVIWFILAASILETETPYQLFNATSGNIETGVHTYSSKVSPEMVYFFQMMAIIMFLFNIFVSYLGLAGVVKSWKTQKEE